MTPLVQAGVFLITTLFGLYLGAIMLRLLLQMVRADFYNPLSQFLVKVTNPPLKPLRRVIPGFAGIDMASVVLMLVLKMLEIFLLSLILGNTGQLQLLGLVIYSLLELLALLVNIYLFAIIIQAILSWVIHGGYNPVAALLHQLTDPLLRPARRLIPPLSGLDLSPMAVIIGIILVQILFVNPLLKWASAMAFSASALNLLP